MKAVLLGLNNPHSSDPALALGTDRNGSSGFRLWLMFKEAANRQHQDATESDYLEAFDRRNLVDTMRWDPKLFKEKKATTLESLVGRRVVMLGQRVPQALGFGTETKFTPVHLMGFVHWVVPHPSGLNRLYNDPAMGRRVGDLLWSLRNG